MRSRAFGVRRSQISACLKPACKFGSHFRCTLFQNLFNTEGNTFLAIVGVVCLSGVVFHSSRVFVPNGIRTTKNRQCEKICQMVEFEGSDINVMFFTCFYELIRERRLLSPNEIFSIFPPLQCQCNCKNPIFLAGAIQPARF